MDRTKSGWLSNVTRKKIKRALASGLEDLCPESPDYGKVTDMARIVESLLEASDLSVRLPFERTYEMRVEICGTSMSWQLIGKGKEDAAHDGAEDGSAPQPPTPYPNGERYLSVRCVCI